MFSDCRRTILKKRKKMRSNRKIQLKRKGQVGFIKLSLLLINTMESKQGPLLCDGSEAFLGGIVLNER